MICLRAGFSFQTQHSPLYPLLSLPFCIFTQSIYHNVVYHLISPSAGSSFLASGPSNFFYSSSLSVPALFFILPLFQAQLHFLFYLSVLHPPPFSIFTSQMLPVVLFIPCPSLCTIQRTPYKALHYNAFHETHHGSQPVRS